MKTTALALLTSLVATGAMAENPLGRLTESLDSARWVESQWISVVDAPVVTGAIGGANERAADGASWFVTKIKNDKKVTSARWMTSGLGVFNLFVNGKPIGEEILKPGFTHYGKTKISYTYDITDAIIRKAGAENVFSVQVTPGWWADKIITPGGNDGMIGRKVAFRGVLELTFTDGSAEYFGTNTSDWKAGVAGAVKHAAIFDGEEYDARELAVITDDAGMSAPEENSEFQGGIFPTAGAEIYRRKDLALSPVEAYSWKGVTGESNDAHGTVVKVKQFDAAGELVVNPGETVVVDFGQNCAAVPEFDFQAAEGTTLTCLPAELLNDGNGAHSRGMDGPEGSVHRRNLRIPEIGMILKYTFGDNKDYVTYSPQCTFYGYRYLSLTADGEVHIKKLQSIPVTSIAAEMETGKIVTGNESVNKLIENTLWGMRSNYLSVPTDCPQRNERLGWTADTQVFSETGTYFANTDRFFHKWMRDMRDTQDPSGAYPGVAPLAQYGAFPNDMARLGWADAGIIVPWVVWKQYGDTAIIAENWSSMERFMDLLNETKYDHNALINHNANYQWADWLSYEPLESCSGRSHYNDENGNWVPRPEAVDYWNYLCASYWLMDAEMMRDMARATGRDYTKYDLMASRARNYIKTQFIDENGRFKNEILNTMQTPALFALKNNILTGKAKEDMIQRLRENFTNHDNCLQTGFLGTSILMPTLTENGMSDIAYELLLQRKNPSWLYSIDNGATTIWERWNSYMLDSGMGPAGMNSFNHYAYGCVCEWIWETVAGISADSTNPGFSNIILRPVPDPRLGFVDAELKTPAGIIKSNWKYEGDKWIWNFSIPAGTVAEVTIPGETTTRQYTAGNYKIIRNI